MEIFGARAGADMAGAIREGRFEIDDLVAALGTSKGATETTADATVTAGRMPAAEPEWSDLPSMPVNPPPDAIDLSQSTRFFHLAAFSVVVLRGGRPSVEAFPLSRLAVLSRADTIPEAPDG